MRVQSTAEDGLAARRRSGGGRVARTLAVAVAVTAAAVSAVAAPAMPAAADTRPPAINRGVAAWGSNYTWQLGDGTDTPWRTTPVAVLGLTGVGVSTVSGGYTHSAAVNGANGTVWTWGSNAVGQLGDGTLTPRIAPVQVTGLTGSFTQVAAGGTHTLALRSDGTVWAWGYNSDGELGDGTDTELRSTPVQVAGLTDVTQIATDHGNGYSGFSIALRSDGTVWTWGDNEHGQLGDGSLVDRRTPVQVAGLTGVTRIAAGAMHALALRSDGKVWAWGWNKYGQLGDGTTVDHSTPVQVAGLNKANQIAAGSVHSLATTRLNRVSPARAAFAWGANSFGQLGDGTHTHRSVPAQVTGLTLGSTDGITQIAGGDLHSLAVRSDGTVWTWGGNQYGQLGDGTMTNRSTAGQVPGMTGTTQVTAGYQHSLALALLPPEYGR